jgi:hypothetical protein
MDHTSTCLIFLLLFLLLGIDFCLDIKETIHSIASVPMLQ